jgi:hypothetical protein
VVASRPNADDRTPVDLQEAIMPLTRPYYSISPEDRQVYHDKSNCPDGERILPQNRRDGTDNRPHCRECPKVS